MSGGNNVVITWESTPQLFRAYDADDFDGMEDGYHLEGWGKTEAEARADLAEQYAEESA